nr:tyrosine aminotransferase [Onthophagus taurus]
MLETPIIDELGYNEKTQKEWKITASKAAKNCKNYIRDIVDNLNLEPNPEKKVIALSLGDPTVYGNLKPSQETLESILEVINECSSNGYAPCVGYESARLAVAEYLSHDGVEISPKDIILCSGCSSALDLCISVLADAGKNHNILMPRPGFPIYRTLAESNGVKVKTYNLLSEKNWQVDLYDLESQIDENTSAIVVNNPSNPCGSVFDEEHLAKILNIARKYQVPVIADEIYERLVFPEKKFVSMASLESGVPMLICGGLAKRFLIPGWRMGWIVIHDPVNALDEIKKGLLCLSQKTIGSNTIVQGALPKILKTPQNFHDDLINTLCENATLTFDQIKDIPGLIPYMPDGAMYMMVKICLEHFPQFQTGLQFVRRLMEEESVFCLPGDCFELPGFMRLVITLPSELMLEAGDRIKAFCNKYYT